ncbi:hypothetical protein I305_06342 [Cryptococcus gattii E566]|uniref:Uncharacterized protein n=1 Tax=Cryptococcus gattii EJB2 TaxID=1296103 RepID=A0ABR5BME3_9TREE|nr:hypothetical protein I306_06181 [Cryptococcus gattii EJB2]KIY31234.1 hypothetical protein I305_06342 [Cryptococcus gattii E566]
MHRLRRYALSNWQRSGFFIQPLGWRAAKNGSSSQAVSSGSGEGGKKVEGRIGEVLWADRAYQCSRPSSFEPDESLCFVTLDGVLEKVERLPVPCILSFHALNHFKT